MKYQETETVKLKKKLNRNFAKEVVAFLNTRDGIIYLGIADDGTIVGIKDVNKTMREVRDIIRDQILPKTTDLCEIISTIVDDKFIIGVKVKKGNKLYYLKKAGRSAAGCFYRDGVSSAPMDEDEIDKRLLESLSVKEVSLIDIPSSEDDLTFNRFKILLDAKGYDTSNKNLLKNLSLFTQDGKYNKVAQLIADKNSLPSIQVCKYQGNTKADFSIREEYGHYSLLLIFDDIKRFLNSLNVTYIDDSVMPRRTKTMFDMGAVEEALVNAFVHNDWANKLPPAVYIYSDRLEILSYGGLVDGITKQEFFDGVSRPRNLELMEIFLYCGFVERTGHGVPKIIKAYGKQAFKFLKSGILVTIPFDTVGLMKEKMKPKTRPKMRLKKKLKELWFLK